tara:strand:+ start:1733 stop:2476 length:744 start_codon:yes stop_codon:yes gene_type:complete
MTKKTIKKKTIKKKIKKKNKRMYFDEEVQAAIEQYNNETDSMIRNALYRDKIEYAFDKLCESIINTFKFSYFDSRFEDIKHEVVAFLVLNMHKYDSSKGFKAFSYFSVVAKNYLIFHNNANYKKLKSHNDIDSNITEIIQHSISKRSVDDVGRYAKDFAEQIVFYFENRGDKIFKKTSDLRIMYSVLELMKGVDKVENFNKKAIYLLVREMTGVKTSEITKVLNMMRKHYPKISKEFSQTGSVTSII